MAKKRKAKKKAPAAPAKSALTSEEKALIVKTLDQAINARLHLDAQAVSKLLKKLRVKKS